MTPEEIYIKFIKKGSKGEFEKDVIKESLEEWTLFGNEKPTPNEMMPGFKEVCIQLIKFTQENS